jgi:uncharacterized protein (DUF2141 family)
MTKLILAFALFLISLFTFSQKNEINELEHTYSVTVTAKNIYNNKGKVYFSLYKKEGFLRTPVSVEVGDIDNGSSTVTFNVKNPDTYAVICYHDSNDNKRLDFNQSGMPTEDYGSTNNIIRFGPPQFIDAKFELSDKDLIFEIKL